MMTITKKMKANRKLLYLMSISYSSFFIVSEKIVEEIEGVCYNFKKLK